MNVIVPGFLEDQCILALKCLAKFIPENGNMVEIGSHFGRSTVFWSKCSHKSIKITAIDSWEDYNWHTKSKENLLENDKIEIIFPEDLDYCYSNRHEIFKYFTEDYKNITSIKTLSPPNQNLVEHLFNLDLIFIDGDHSFDGVSKDMEFWYPRLNNNGIFCGHDYYNHSHSSLSYYNPDVKLAVDLFVEKQKLFFIPNFVGSYFWVAVKNEQIFNLLKDINNQKLS